MKSDETTPAVPPVAAESAENRLARRFHEIFVQRGPIPRRYGEMPAMYQMLLRQMFGLLLECTRAARDPEGTISARMDTARQESDEARVTDVQMAAALSTLNVEGHGNMAWQSTGSFVVGSNPTGTTRILTRFEAVAIASFYRAASSPSSRP